MAKKRHLQVALIVWGLLCIGTTDLLAQAIRSDGAGRSSHQTEKSNRPDYYHFGYASVGIGYTSLQEGIQHVTPIGGFGNQIGIGYEFRYQNFWLSIGGQVNWIRTQSLLDNYRIDHNVVWQNAATLSNGSTANINGVAHYDIQQCDTMNVMMVDIPLMLGYYIQGFYVGVGAKVGLGQNTKIGAGGRYTLSATTDKYIDPYKLGEYDFHTEQTIRFAPQVSVCGEIGYDVLSMIPTRSPFCHILKVGFYFEVGVNSMVRPVSSNAQQMTYHGEAPTSGTPANEVVFNPYYTSGMTVAQRVAPFYTGLKVTYMFGGSKNNNHGVAHRGCQCYE